MSSNYIITDGTFNDNVDSYVGKDTRYILLTREEAAQYTGLNISTLAVWKRDRIPYIKLGKLTRYRLSDLNTFIEKSISKSST